MKLQVEAAKIEDSRPASGRLSMKLWYDWNNSKLQVTVVSAQDLEPRDGPEKENPYAFAKIHLLPERGLVGILGLYVQF